MRERTGAAVLLTMSTVRTAVAMSCGRAETSTRLPLPGRPLTVPSAVSGDTDHTAVTVGDTDHTVPATVADDEPASSPRDRSRSTTSSALTTTTASTGPPTTCHPLLNPTINGQCPQQPVQLNPAMCSKLAGDNRVLSAFVTTAGHAASVVTALQGGGNPPEPSARPSPLTNRPDDEPLLLCYVDGHFPVSQPSGSKPADRGLMAMNANGQVGLLAAGPHESFPISTP